MVSPTPHQSGERAWSWPWHGPGSTEGGGCRCQCWGFLAADGLSRAGAGAEPRTCEQTGREFTIKAIK